MLWYIFTLSVTLFCHFGENISICQYLIFQLFGKILNLLWYYFGCGANFNWRTWMANYWIKNVPIWTHCSPHWFFNSVGDCIWDSFEWELLPQILLCESFSPKAKSIFFSHLHTFISFPSASFLFFDICVFLNGPSPASFLLIFGSFQTNINTIFATN